jgi:hypothetical protein
MRSSWGGAFRAEPETLTESVVEDYYPSGKRFLLRLKEKRGKEKELPVHHKLEELLDLSISTLKQAA